jgi:hypothetical protein
MLPVERITPWIGGGIVKEVWVDRGWDAVGDTRRSLIKWGVAMARWVWGDRLTSRFRRAKRPLPLPVATDRAVDVRIRRQLPERPPGTGGDGAIDARSKRQLPAG